VNPDEVRRCSSATLPAFVVAPLEQCSTAVRSLQWMLEISKMRYALFLHYQFVYGVR
jgi:hypothetical protein